MPADQFLGWRGKERKGTTRLEVHADDRRMLRRIDDEETIVRSGHHSAGVACESIAVERIVDPKLVLAKVEDQFCRPVRKNPFSGMWRRIVAVPEHVHEGIERGTRSVGQAQHDDSSSGNGTTATGEATRGSVIILDNS